MEGCIKTNTVKINGLDTTYFIKDNAVVGRMTYCPKEQEERWYVGDVLYRADGPAIVRYTDGQISYSRWHTADGQPGRQHDLPHEVRYKGTNIATQTWLNAAGQPHRTNGHPAVIHFKEGEITEKIWYVDGVLQSIDDQPARILYENTEPICEHWYRDGKRHRVGGPAVLVYENGEKTREYWFVDDKQHRVDGPAVIKYSGGKVVSEKIYRNGKLCDPIEDELTKIEAAVAAIRKRLAK